MSQPEATTKSIQKQEHRACANACVVWLDKAYLPGSYFADFAKCLKKCRNISEKVTLVGKAS